MVCEIFVCTFIFCGLYRETLVVEYLGWVDLDLGSSPGWWAAIVATYCQIRVVKV